jgi:hypothetical protein
MKETLALLWAIYWGAIAVCLHLRYGLKTTGLGLLLGFAIVGGLTIQVHDIVKKFRGPGGWEIETSIEKINQATDQAIQRLANEVSTHSERISQLIATAKEQEGKLQEAILMAAPPVLSLASPPLIEKIDGGYKAVLTFRPSKNQQLDLVQFLAEIVSGEDAKIRVFSAASGPVRGSGQGEISHDGKVGLTYSPIGFAFPKIELQTSTIGKVRLSGNYLPQPIDVEMK